MTLEAWKPNQLVIVLENEVVTGSDDRMVRMSDLVTLNGRQMTALLGAIVFEVDVAIATACSSHIQKGSV